MTLEEYNTFCGSLPHTHHVVQWGGAHVWKVASKVFAVSGWDDGQGDGRGITFKVSQIAYEVLKTQPGLRPAPYLASRGMTWIQRTTQETMDDETLKDYLRQSHHLAAQNLTQKMRKELGLYQDHPIAPSRP